MAKRVRQHAFTSWFTVFTIALVMIGTGRSPISAHSNRGYSHDSSPGVTNTDWLASVPGCLRLSEISWPGTHDTMARKDSFTDYVQTQSMSLETQLNSGIRVLDIRVRHIADSFAIHHGAVFLDAFFGGDVMEPVIEFLQAHPDETVLMRIKDEYDEADNTRTWEETFQSYMDLYGSHVWQPTGEIPTLGEVRGKIVILQNFSTDKTYGLNYNDLDDQDYYGLENNWDLYNKWEKVKAHIEKAEHGSRGTIYINYLSGSFEAGDGPVFPYFVASGHVSHGTGAARLATGRTSPGWSSWEDFPRVDCAFGICTIAFEGTNVLTYEYISDGKTNFTGIVMADFPGGGLIESIIGLNPTNHAPSASAGGPYTTQESTPIAFSAAGSSDRDGDALAYRWDFDGNGSWDTSWSNNPVASHTWMDDWTGTATLAVSDGCDVTTATASVQVSNVPPQVAVTQIADGEPFILTHLVVNLRAAFSDPGLDSHQASIAWQNGTPAATLRSPATSPLADSRVYTVPGTYAVTVTAQDDDGGVGQAGANVRILSAQDSLTVLIGSLRPLAANRGIANALANLEGNNGGKASNGAADELAKGNINAAFGKLLQALDALIAAEQSTPGLDVARAKQLLTNIGRSIALDAIAHAAAAGTAPVKVTQANAELSQGVSLQDAGDHYGALTRYRGAARRVQGAA